MTFTKPFYIFENQNRFEYVMKIKLYCIGKTNFSFIEEGIMLYQKRIMHFIDFEVIYLPDIKNVKNMPVSELKKKEGQVLIKNIGVNDFLCLLDEKGMIFSSESFGRKLGEKMDQGLKVLVFVIGGAFGFSDEIYERANMKISLSSMTFSHQIVRLIFMEQLYRAFTIIKGIPYHNQ
jgi:23S rRNA (pseudouridine1915-N3)-methyltransferase